MLQQIFGDITNDGGDHWSPMGSNPLVPASQEIEGDNVGALVDEDEINVDDGGDEVQEVSPIIANAKRRDRVVSDKAKKPKSGTSLIIQEQVSKIADSASSYTKIAEARKQAEVTVKEVMDLVLACGAGYETNEHFIATELFVKKDQRDMFMTLPTNEFRFNWLKRKYIHKYGN